ncbi:hypothetical protein D9613_006572 [Agrocybe pediades]|uniref:Uncharacterized protein n=1 Tax=Agrocybe pediades TaxID=84607 RepID=A0A8H4QGE6_9AGAR|nr:hypothetical protein D9613_006572 [Agrocybe pediades]
MRIHHLPKPKQQPATMKSNFISIFLFSSFAIYANAIVPIRVDHTLHYTSTVDSGPTLVSKHPLPAMPTDIIHCSIASNEKPCPAGGRCCGPVSLEGGRCLFGPGTACPA